MYQYYVYPYFQQDWQLFAEPLHEHTQTFVLLKQQGEVRWYSIDEICGGNEFLRLSLYNASFHLRQTLAAQSVSGGLILVSASRKVWEQLIKGLFKRSEFSPLPVLAYCMVVNSVKPERESRYYWLW
ncbi:MAG: hypothetical protein QM534_01735 [Sediminibacterium sp.]|nr:hypothetical protein [Sediminibacterium sp.]